MKKYVYLFEEGNRTMKELLGGKGSNLAEMTNLGIPVPPGFTITTEACAEYSNNVKWPEGLKEQIDEALDNLENKMGKKLGDENDPLLVSVRSGAAISMPGMMDTVLNLGLNDKSVLGLAKQTNNERFSWDAYRRFINMFGDVVMGIEHKFFEEKLDEIKKQKSVKLDTQLNADDLKNLCEKYKEVVKVHAGKLFPEEPKEQLTMAINAVFDSWNNKRAIEYRKINKITGLLGTAVNIQSMVFGNKGETSGTGVFFTRNPSTGENEFYGEFLMNAQGEDVVAGIRTPEPITALNRIMPQCYEQLVDIYTNVEKHYKDMQDMEFTIEDAHLYILQTRNGKRTGKAAVKIAVDMVKEGLITEQEAIMRINSDQLDQLLHKQFDLKELEKVKKEVLIAKGLPASPGAAVGQVVFTADDAHTAAEKGKSVILVRTETSPEDIKGMNAAKGILTSRGGMTSHAAVVARGMGKCCVAGCEEVIVDESIKQFMVGDLTVKEGEWISVNGTTGEVYLGKIDTVAPELAGEFATLMEWADKYRTMGVRTNADTPKDSKKAREFGAQGIGLCRTEHMFFEGDRIIAVREMILSETLEERKMALEKLLPMQKEDFKGIFKEMTGFPVTIRLLDPPLHGGRRIIDFRAASRDEQQD
jgi:pyruvate,orthophosphate dikinase